MMFQDLIDLFSGWYTSYLTSIKGIMEVTNTVTDTVNNTVESTTVVPEVWSAFVPWEALIASIVLIVFIVMAFKFLRTVICRMF